MLMMRIQEWNSSLLNTFLNGQFFLYSHNGWYYVWFRHTIFGHDQPKYHLRFKYPLSFHLNIICSTVSVIVWIFCYVANGQSKVFLSINDIVIYDQRMYKAFGMFFYGCLLAFIISGAHHFHFTHEVGFNLDCLCDVLVWAARIQLTALELGWFMISMRLFNHFTCDAVIILTLLPDPDFRFTKLACSKFLVILWTVLLGTPSNLKCYSVGNLPIFLWVAQYCTIC